MPSQSIGSCEQFFLMCIIYYGASSAVCNCKRWKHHGAVDLLGRQTTVQELCGKSYAASQKLRIESDQNFTDGGIMGLLLSSIDLPICTCNLEC